MRVIARIDIKNDYVIKGIHLEGLRRVGDPNALAVRYYNDGAEEIIFMDAVASLYERNNLFHIIEKACQDVFIPITVGGGIRTIDDIKKALKAGADKVAINTAAIKNPRLIQEASREIGSQSLIGSIEAKRHGSGWEAYIDNGREKTGVDAVEWAGRLEELGAGEIMVTSVDMEGTMLGFDLELAEQICRTVHVPVIISGGMGKLEHLGVLMERAAPGAVAVASVAHYNKLGFEAMKNAACPVGVRTGV
jgi:imidazole glycerol-phosphate synthase subunit HisF